MKNMRYKITIVKPCNTGDEMVIVGERSMGLKIFNNIKHFMEIFFPFLD